MNRLGLIAWARATASAILILLLMQPAHADPITIAIEDKDWAPYYIWVEGEPVGPCPEIAAGAIQLMGSEAKFTGVPWVRVLRGVEKQKFDAGLCGTKNAERAAYSHYPEEPLLSYDATLFVRADSPLRSSSLEGLKGKSLGTIKGYSYGDTDKLLEENGMSRSETTDRETLLRLLMRGRVDAVLDSILPVVFDARRLGLQDQIRALPPSLSEAPAYLFFSQRPGNEDLAKRFSAALKEFKNAAEYAAIKESYGF